MVGVIETPVAPTEAGAPGPEKNAPIRRVKRLERPNKAALEEGIAKIFEEVDGFQARVHEIKTILDNKQQNRGFTSQEHQEARGRLTDLSATFRGILEAKKALRDELDAVEKERERRRAEARTLREKLPYVRVEQIDEEIKKLDYRLSHTSLTLQEEKKVLQQMKDLTKSREFVKDYNDRIEKVSQDDSTRTSLIEKIKEKDQLLNNLKVQEQQQRKIIAEIREKEASRSVDIPALIEERNGAFEKMKTLREEAKELRAEFRSKEDEFWEREREWKEQQAIERKRAFEKREAERKEREEFRKQRELENFVEPYTDEIILCDQLFHYLQKYAPTTEEAASTASSQKVEIQAPKGVGNVILSKKHRNDEELEGWFAGSGGRGKGKKAGASSGPKSREKEIISLSLDAITSCQKISLSPPTTVGDVAKCLEEVKAKKDNFVKLQKEAREARESGREVESKPVLVEEVGTSPSEVETNPPEVVTSPPEVETSPPEELKDTNENDTVVEEPEPEVLI